MRDKPCILLGNLFNLDIYKTRINRYIFLRFMGIWIKENKTSGASLFWNLHERKTKKRLEKKTTTNRSGNISLIMHYVSFKDWNRNNPDSQSRLNKLPKEYKDKDSNIMRV